MLLEESNGFHDCLTKMNDLGSQAFSESELDNCENVPERLEKILSQQHKNKNLSPEIKDLLPKIKDALKDLSKRFEDQLIASDIEERIDLLDALTDDAKEGIKKEKELDNIIATETILASLPFCNDMIENILKNGIDSLSPEDLQKLRETHDVIEASLNKLLNNKNLSPSMKDLLEKTKKNLIKDKESISQKLSECQIKRKKEQVDDLIKEIEDGVPEEKIKELKVNIEIVMKLQEKIAKDGIKSLTNKELTELAEKQEVVKTLIETLKEDPKVDTKSKDKLDAIIEATEKASDSIKNKVELDKISRLIKDLNNNINGLKALDENKDNEKVNKLKDYVNLLVDVLSLLMNKGLDAIHLTELSKLESNTKDALAANVALQHDPKCSLATKTLLKKLKDTIDEILPFTNKLLLSHIKEEFDDILEDIEDISRMNDDPNLKVFDKV